MKELFFHKRNGEHNEIILYKHQTKISKETPKMELYLGHTLTSTISDADFVNVEASGYMILNEFLEV